jgi:DNA-binding response OmpR family regulator
MAKWAIYLTDSENLDAALEKGVTEAGCRIDCAHSVSEVIHWLRLRGVIPASGLKAAYPSHSSALNTNGNTIILVASVKGGAIPLLTLLREQGYEPPPTLIFDEDGNDVHTIVRALQLGAREYVLASDPELQRALSARLLVERVSADHIEQQATLDSIPAKPAQSEGFEWDPIGRVIHIGDEYVRLSSVEGRIFDMLYQNRNHTVQVSELVPYVLLHQDLEISIGARRLRPHIMRLRRKLEQYPILEMRIVNMRGTGYMLI